MRVLLLSERLADPDALGGVEVHVADLGASLPSSAEPFLAHLRAGRLVVERVRPQRSELASLPADTLGESLETALLALDIDVLHVHSPQIGPSAIANAARACHVPIVLTLHDLLLSELDGQALVAATTHFVAPSRFVRDALAERYPGIRERTRLLRWGVPEQRRVTSPPRADAVGDRPLRVAVVGVLVADKGAAVLPELMRACERSNVEWHLFGATEGRSVRDIRQAARRVTFHGAYRRHELGARLDAARIDLALLPSVFLESFNMALSECVAAGVPVIASDLGALRERVIDEACGWTFDPWQPASLVSALEQARAGDALDRLRSELGRRPVRTREEMAKEHAELYAEVLKACGGVDPGRAASRDDRAVDMRSHRDQRRLAARQRFDASPPIGSPTLRRAWRTVRRSRLYRELPFRRLLPEAVRAGVESRVGRLLDRWRR